MSSHYVYVIVNKINLKLYFGSHSWEGTGVDKNYYGSGTAIKRAVRKYGKDNFIVYPIKFYDTIEECRQAEEELLTKYDIANNQYCYNLKNGAIGWTSEDMAGENNPMYGRTGENSPNYGKKATKETRQKISENHRAMTGENNHMYGKHHTEETRKKIAQARKENWKNEEYRKRRTGENNPMFGKHLSKETRQKLSESLKGRKFSDETRQKMSQAKKYLMTPVVAIDKNGKVKIFESQAECSRVLGVNSGSINNCLKGKQKTCKGYLIKYLEQLESGIYEGITEGIAE